MTRNESLMGFLLEAVHSSTLVDTPLLLHTGYVTSRAEIVPRAGHSYPRRCTTPDPSSQWEKKIATRCVHAGDSTKFKSTVIIRERPTNPSLFQDDGEP